MFTYFVEKNCVSITDSSKILNTNKVNVNCPTCEEIYNESIHYEGHIIKYLHTK